MPITYYVIQLIHNDLTSSIFLNVNYFLWRLLFISTIVYYIWIDHHCNKANLRNSIAPTGLLILLKLDSNHQLFSPCDLEMGHLFSTTSRFVHHYKGMGEFKLKLQSGNAQFESTSMTFVPCDLEIWWMTLKTNRDSLLYNFRFCASFKRHGWIQTWVTWWKRSDGQTDGWTEVGLIHW